MQLSVSALKKITGGDIPLSGSESGWQATGISTDTRTIKPGDLFIALEGENFNGHDYTGQALEKGAAAVVVSRELPAIAPQKQLVVADTLKALQAIGTAMAQKFSGCKIGITGSAGKTSTREALKAVLGHFGATFGTKRNYNNHIGVPLTLCDIPLEGDYAVIEMAMSAGGEISALTQMARPDIALVTNIHPMHIEFFDSLEGIAHAKAEIYEGLSADGTAIYNADANHADVLAAKIKSQGIRNVLTFGREGDVRLKSATQAHGKTDVCAVINGKEVRFTLSSPGMHRVYNALAVLAVIVALGLDPAQAAPHLDDVGLLEGRGKTHIVPVKNGQITLIDESYSGQPEAMKLAIQNLAHTTPLKNGRKIAVLGYMAELGAHTEAEHRAVGREAATAGLDIVFGVGLAARPLLEEAKKGCEVHYREDISGLAQHLRGEVLKDGDVILVKGSHHGSKVYQLVEELLNPKSS